MIHLNRSCIWRKSRRDFPDVQISDSSMQMEKEKGGVFRSRLSCVSRPDLEYAPLLVELHFLDVAQTEWPIPVGVAIKAEYDWCLIIIVEPLEVFL